MTQVVTVQTDFTDLNQMAQGLVGRVNDTHVILPGPEPVDVGDWVQFAVTLYDGTPGFAGVGRCVTVVDNGEERLSHQRFDVVIDSLQFDPRGQQVFEHILTLNGAGYAEDAGEAYPAQDDVGADVEEGDDVGSYEDVSSDFTGSRIELPVESLGEAEQQATTHGERPALRSVPDEADDLAFEAPTIPPVAAARPMHDHLEGEDHDAPAAPVGSHAVAAPSSAPDLRAQVNGTAFAYPNGLPFPAEPPRPSLDATQRVSPAPRPAGSHH